MDITGIPSSTIESGIGIRSDEIVKLISILDPYRNRKLEKTVFSLIIPEDWLRYWFWGFTCIEVVVVVAMLFWPMSIIISMFEFITWRKGGWVLWCFALVTWLLVIAGGGITILILPFTVDTVAKRKGEVSKWTIKQLEAVRFASMYVGLKMFVILREYTVRYTGVGTRKPDWLDWLN
jgi:hypothetical protein